MDINPNCKPLTGVQMMPKILGMKMKEIKGGMFCVHPVHKAVNGDLIRAGSEEVDQPGVMKRLREPARKLLAYLPRVSSKQTP